MKRILVADDDNDILEIVDLILSQHKYVVDKVRSGDEIFTVTKMFKPNLILLDASLHGFNILSLCTSLKSEDNTRDIPVILFSALNDLEKFCKLCGAVDYIEKPFEISTFVEKIKKHA